ncbi:MAG: hypothetical protein PUK75_07290 [bacterium]|nr:hypothetical protein [bacterium]MDY4100688.1 hypothetical protein [Lachnospiraceae bacterium]
MPEDFLEKKKQQYVGLEAHREAENQAAQIGKVQQQMQMEQQEEIQPVVRNMETDARIEQTDPIATHKETRSEKKKREQLESAQKKAQQQSEILQRLDQKVKEHVRKKRQFVLTKEDEQQQNEQEKEKALLLKEQLKASTLREKAARLEAGDQASEQRKMEIAMEGKLERAKLLADYAKSLDVGSKQRRLALMAKEKQEIEANKLRKKMKVSNMENEVERKREEATIKRHKKYDDLKKIFRKDNPLSYENATYIHDGHLLRNIGRAFLGGTKPMYIFEDRDAPIIADGQIVGYKQYLFKEAVNCIGFEKPEGALVTEAAAQLQELLCGPYSIPAFAALHEGKVVGSFQEKIDSIEADQRVDLFQWQTNPQDNIPAEMKKEILREHTLDWLLCNFDTKGENFIHRTDGHLCSFDKEASFSKLNDEGAAHMSTTYKPHANDTLYNTIFTEYAEGRMELDLASVNEQISKVENIDDEAYLKIFDAMLTNKYGKASEKNVARAKVEQKMLDRKNGLRKEYERFFAELNERRQSAGS